MSRTQANTAFSGTASNVVGVINAQRTIVSTAPQRSWHAGVVQQLTNLLRLPPGWDGYRGRPVTLENATFAIRVLEACCGDTAPEPDIVPGPNGDLQLEWHAPGIDIELHVLAPNDVVAWHADQTTGLDGVERPLRNDFTEVQTWIDTLVRANRAAATAAA